MNREAELVKAKLNAGMSSAAQIDTGILVLLGGIGILNPFVIAGGGLLIARGARNHAKHEHPEEYARKEEDRLRRDAAVGPLGAAGRRLFRTLVLQTPVNKSITIDTSVAPQS